MIRDIVNPVPLEIGQEFDGKVVKTIDFGAFVNVVAGQGRAHPHLQARRRASGSSKVEDVINVGDSSA